MGGQCASYFSVYNVHCPSVQALSYARWLLTLGLVYVFLFFGIDKLVRPLLWIGWMPPWFEGVVGATRNQWLMAFGILEIALGLLLLLPKVKLQRVVTSLMAFHLVAVITQVGLFTDIGVRDIGLLFATVALLCLL